MQLNSPDLSNPDPKEPPKTGEMLILPPRRRFFRLSFAFRQFIASSLLT
jgi:hypothetical protein